MFDWFKKRKDLPPVKPPEKVKKVVASKHVTGEQPRGKRADKFKALETFYSIETKSMYVKGMTYNVLVGNALMLRMVKIWREQGKVK